VKDTYNPRRKDNLLDLLTQSLRDKVKPMLADSAQRAELRAGIQAYIDKVRLKLGNRDFSRLISARLTYREVAALEKFLKNMDLEAYLSGKEA